jgi:hypothetical protein
MAARRFHSRCEVDLLMDCATGCATAEVAMLRRRHGFSRGRASWCWAESLWGKTVACVVEASRALATDGVHWLCVR